MPHFPHRFVYKKYQNIRIYKFKLFKLFTYVFMSNEYIVRVIVEAFALFILNDIKLVKLFNIK